ncbi:hypothetical protein BH11PLA2_BH11PLA2_25650 [soil metagenome]
MFVRCIALLFAVMLLGTAPVVAEDKKETKPHAKEEPPKEKKGTVTGVVTAKDEKWIEVKADGEDKARKYVAHWRGGNPKDGGGPDKEMLAKFKEIPLNARVRLEWVFAEHMRVEKIEVLKKDGTAAPEKK